MGQYMKKNRLKKRIADKLGLPPESALNSLRVVIINGNCFVENHNGILKYTQTEIKIRLNGKVCRICGQDMSIEHVHLKDIKINGEISFVSLEGK